LQYPTRNIAVVQGDANAITDTNFADKRLRYEIIKNLVNASYIWNDACDYRHGITTDQSLTAALNSFKRDNVSQVKSESCRPK